MNDGNIKFQYLDELYENITLMSVNSEKELKTYLAKNKQTGKIVVKKYIDSSVVNIYEKLKALNHKNIEHVIEVAKSVKSGIAITEYISGVSINDLLEKGPLDEEFASEILIQITDALVELDTINIVHRDINTNNVIISNDNVAKLVDFGISREVKQDRNQDTTILGTAGYAAPEQFGFAQTDTRSDIYSLGVLLNVMLTGQFPNNNKYAKKPLSLIIDQCICIDANNRVKNGTTLKRNLQLCRITRYQALSDFNKKFDNLINNGFVDDVRKLFRKTDTSNWIILNTIPGFRTGVPIKAIIALWGYFCMVVYSLSTIQTCNTTVLSTVLEVIALAAYIWIMPLVIANVAHWSDKCKITKKLPKYLKIGIRILIGVIIFILGLYLDSYVKTDLLKLKSN